jgi:hypothetical protein
MISRGVLHVFDHAWRPVLDPMRKRCDTTLGTPLRVDLLCSGVDIHRPSFRIYVLYFYLSLHLLYHLYIQTSSTITKRKRRLDSQR